MKEFFIAMIVAAALLICFREPNSAHEFYDFKCFARLCLQTGERMLQ